MTAAVLAMIIVLFLVAAIFGGLAAQRGRLDDRAPRLAAHLARAVERMNGDSQRPRTG
ncbi:MAG TPA: hypothetical protein VK020_07420 [Microlunatus sp.]|nr:hypothetical protein [Microlunatus sp.]